MPCHLQQPTIKDSNVNNWQHVNAKFTFRELDSSLLQLRTSEKEKNVSLRVNAHGGSGSTAGL